MGEEGIAPRICLGLAEVPEIVSVRSFAPRQPEQNFA